VVGFGLFWFWFWFWFCGYLERRVSNNLAKTVAPKLPRIKGARFSVISDHLGVAWHMVFIFHAPCNKIYCVCTPLLPEFGKIQFGWLVGWLVASQNRNNTRTSIYRNTGD
jgi:hypothetical protein